MTEFSSCFAMSPAQAAKVSEISEKTASSSVSPEDRINFHIGNPVQDKRLLDYFFSAVAGANPLKNEFINPLTLEQNEELSSLSAGNLKLLFNIIKNSAPYMPRGGYAKNPHNLVTKIYNFLNNDKKDPLEYSLEKRECIIASGGLFESLRVFFSALSKFLINKPVTVALWRIKLPDYLYSIPGINFIHIDDKEEAIIDFLKSVKQNSSLPNFLLLGDVISENKRRTIRNQVIQIPVFIVEVNNCENSRSLAREARLENRVLRFLTPDLINPLFKDISVVFIAGNPEFIRIIETMHFQLLGTPSASEVELLDFLWDNIGVCGVENKTNSLNKQDEYRKAAVIETAEKIIERNSNLVEKLTSKYSEKLSSIKLPEDKFAGFSGKFDFIPESNIDVIENLTGNILNPEVLNKKLLHSFIKHHPEYEAGQTILVSGSARAALGIIGFHCGIEEVIIPDLSWTYEHCFRSVEVVPMKEGIKLDDEAIINKVHQKMTANSSWKNKGAVAINNPHNASGKIFPERKIRNLVKNLFALGVCIIDDLSYQKVAPANEDIDYKTVKEIVEDMIRSGEIRSDWRKYLITVHSLSKTDCFAGARLCVVNIPDKALFEKFSGIVKNIKHNSGAILAAYLFYKNDIQVVKNFWLLRNRIFKERMDAILSACNEISAERNIFDIKIIPPTGSMYPQLIIEKLPDGLSLDWLSSNLATNGIGMVPLSTFARSGKGFELARKTFRLTLGGPDGADSLKIKTRRLLITINRLISEEASKNTIIKIPAKVALPENIDKQYDEKWKEYGSEIKKQLNKEIKTRQIEQRYYDYNFYRELSGRYFEERINEFYKRLKDDVNLDILIKNQFEKFSNSELSEKTKKEFYKESLEKRKKLFAERQYDRTVHPTQVYSLRLELLFEKLTELILEGKDPEKKLLKEIAGTFAGEYFGENVSIKSIEEADELILDLNKNSQAEDFIRLTTGKEFDSVLSFWGDWDGSNRPSGQGHRLVAVVALTNIIQMKNILLEIENKIPQKLIPGEVLEEISGLDKNIHRFWELLNEITSLTHQLEKRYQTMLPYLVDNSKVRNFAKKLKLMKDPVITLWQHNDSYEKKMIELRKKRKARLLYYFELNKKLRKTLYDIIPKINDKDILLKIYKYKNLLNRFILTPRIHQKLITSRDQFAIDTTVHNIMEINEIGGLYGNPGLVLALQISMSNDPEALITLDRKLRSKREEVLRNNPDLEIPDVWVIPLFEDIDAVQNIETYLNKLWDYCIQSRRIGEEPASRFVNMICEIFIAGSDLSQQVSQSRSATLYNEVKFRTIKWLAEKGIAHKVRMKLGSGEPMQRQGGYYNRFSGTKVFNEDKSSKYLLSKYLKPSTIKSTEYAITPLLGIFANSDLRTLQSNISEKLRYLSVNERAGIFYHMKKAQQNHLIDIIRAAEPMTATRLKYKEKGLNELKRLTIGDKNKLYDDFVKCATDNFRAILYGSSEDLVGIHLISYFISRTTPTLRDRPTVRPSKDNDINKGQLVLNNISRTIPMNKQGTALRAIGHNHAQTLILGINQLTTGLFRAMEEFAKLHSGQYDKETLISEIILPNLPVYEILLTLKYYHNPELKFLNMIEPAFKAGNSAFMKLREDSDLMYDKLGLLQKELLRRHGISIREFFRGNKFNTKLISTLRPDIAVLMQPDFFNNNIEKMFEGTEAELNENYRNEVLSILEIPEKINYYRNKLWEILEEPIFNQVKSFSELAFAINNFTGKNSEIKIASGLGGSVKLNQNLSNLLKGSADDNMKQFLQAAVQYLTSLPENFNAVPVDIIRALKDVESILKIEEQALRNEKLKMYNFYSLQIARICGENG